MVLRYRFYIQWEAVNRRLKPHIFAMAVNPTADRRDPPMVERSTAALPTLSTGITTSRVVLPRLLREPSRAVRLELLHHGDHDCKPLVIEWDASPRSLRFMSGGFIAHKVRVHESMFLVLPPLSLRTISRRKLLVVVFIESEQGDCYFCSAMRR